MWADHIRGAPKAAKTPLLCNLDAIELAWDLLRTDPSEGLVESMRLRVWGSLSYFHHKDQEGDLKFSIAKTPQNLQSLIPDHQSIEHKHTLLQTNMAQHAKHEQSSSGP
ncbi:hypothetical protein ABBQ32_000869 [Trebouxia sp. C0010 RCD-2024]